MARAGKESLLVLGIQRWWGRVGEDAGIGSGVAGVVGMVRRSARAWAEDAVPGCPERHLPRLNHAGQGFTPGGHAEGARGVEANPPRC